mgnify:CR=1 FL=1
MEPLRFRHLVEQIIHEAARHLDHTILSPFRRPDGDLPPIEIKIFQPQTDRLPDSHSATIQQFRNQQIPSTETAQYSLHFLHR